MPRRTVVDSPAPVVKLTKEEAEALKLEAEAAWRRAQAAREKIEARRVKAEAATAELVLFEKQIESQRLQTKRLNEMVSDDEQHVYRFAGVVDGASVAVCMATLERWARVDVLLGREPCDIEVIFTSPGGNALNGFALFDFLRKLSAQGHKIITTDLGFAASMAGILVQAGDVRRIGCESYLHIHEISTGAIGKLSEIEDEVDFAKKMTERVVKIYVDRARGKITEKKLRELFERREAWFNSDEALKYGLVDELV